MSNLTSATGPSNLYLNRLVECIDNVLSGITNKDVLDSGTKLRDLVQPVSSDLSKLLEGILQGAKMLSDQKSLTPKLSTKAQTPALDVLRRVRSTHWTLVAFLVVADVLNRLENISAIDRDCIDILKAMLDLAKFMKQLIDNRFDLQEILEKMSEAVQLIVRGAILCHSFITSNKISKYLLNTTIREELVYVRGKVDSMKSDLDLQMQVLIMSTLTFYISRNHTGEMEQTCIADINGSVSETGSPSIQNNYNEINGHPSPEMVPRTNLGANPPLIAATGPSNLCLNLLIEYMGNVLSAITNKDVLDSRIKLRDLVQLLFPHLSKLFEGILQGAKMLSYQNSLTSKPSAEAQTVVLNELRVLGHAHRPGFGLSVIVCIDLLKAMLSLTKFMKQLKDKKFDLRGEILEKMSEVVQLITHGVILFHSFITSNIKTKFLLTTKIREELVYVRGKVDSMKFDLGLQMKVLIMSKLTLYISRNHTGAMDKTNFLAETEQSSSQQSIDIYGDIDPSYRTDISGLESETGSPNRRTNYNEINGHRLPEMTPRTFWGTNSPPIAATGPSKLSLDLLVQNMDNVLSGITNKDVLDSGTKLKDLVQPVSSDISELFEGISQGAKMLSDRKFLKSKLPREAQRVALAVLRGVGSAHFAAVGLSVVANVLDRIEKIYENNRECIDILKAMLDLAKFMKQLIDNRFDLQEILGKMSEAVELIVRGAILCHAFITSNAKSKFWLSTRIREELVYVRGKVDSMKLDLDLQMQVLIMSTLTFYISRNDRGELEQIYIADISGSVSETGSPSRLDNYNEINGPQSPETAPRSFLGTSPPLIAATGPSNLLLNLLIQYMDNVLSGISNKDVLHSGTKLRDLVQPVSSDLSKLFEGISQGEKMLSYQKSFTSKLPTEAQTVVLNASRVLGHAHWPGFGLSVIACIDLLKAMLSLAKFLKQLQDKKFDLRGEILEKMTEAVQLIVRGLDLCHSFITSNRKSKSLLTTKICEELVYVRGKVDGMKFYLGLQMKDLVMSTLTFYISRNLHTGGMDEMNFLAVTEQFPSQQSSSDIYGEHRIIGNMELAKCLISLNTDTNKAYNFEVLVLDCLAKVLSYRPQDFRYNSSQCNNLSHAFVAKLSPFSANNWRILSATKEVLFTKNRYISTSKLGPEGKTIMERAWKEVYRVVKEAELYLKQCSGDNWWIKSITLSSTGEAYAIHIHDLAWCVLCLHLNHLYAKGQTDERCTLAACIKMGDFRAEMSNLTWIHDEYEDKRRLVTIFQELSRACEGSRMNNEDKRKVGIATFLSAKLQAAILSKPAVEGKRVSPWLQIDPSDLVLNTEVLGEGSSAKVYEGSWLGVKVAVKEFEMFDNDIDDVLQLEIAVHAQLQSPFIVQLIGVCITEKHCYLVMEFVSSSLDRVLQDGPLLSLPVSVNMILQISQAMEYLHSHGIMHMDLKAANVLIQPSEVPEFEARGYGRVKLCDFGESSLRLYSCRKTDDQKGSTYWRAPEVFKYPQEGFEIKEEIQKEYTCKADVYSFAMTCYEILTGTQPFEGVDASSVYRRIVQGERPSLPPSCPLVLADYIRRCWDTDPGSRPNFDDVSNFFRGMKLLLTRMNDSGVWDSSSAYCKKNDIDQLFKCDEEQTSDERAVNLAEEGLIIRALSRDFPESFQPRPLLSRAPNL